MDAFDALPFSAEDLLHLHPFSAEDCGDGCGDSAPYSTASAAGATYSHVRAYTSSSMSAPAACLCQPRLFVSHGVIDTPYERASNSIWLQVGGLVCHMVIEAFRREHAMDPVWRIPERLEMHMQRLHKAFPDCVDVPYALRELRMLGALKTQK